MEHNYVKLEHQNPLHKKTIVINWCIANVCNFACTYCPVILHDGSKKFPDYDTVKNFIDRVIDHYGKDKRYQFEFTGGEVTLWKDFISICKYIKSLDEDVHVGLISNGSRTMRYFEDLKPYIDSICMSFHYEYADPDHFLNVVEFLSDKVRTHVNIMMIPDHFDELLYIAENIREFKNISFALQPLMEGLGGELYPYTDQQLEVFNKQWDMFTKYIKFDKEFPTYRGAMKIIYSDGSSRNSAANRFISSETNKWSGWKCWAGVEQIVVDMDGSVYRGWCGVGGKLGNIKEDINFPKEPVICNKTSCHCNFDIMCTKEKV